MDTLTSFLDGPRARAAFLVKVVMRAPWSISVQDEAPLTVVAPTSGSVWIIPTSAGGAVRLTAGDVAIVKAPSPYVVASGVAEVPTIVVSRGGHCATLDGTSLVEPMGLGVRTWGNAADGDDVMLVGTYESEGEVSRWLLDALPPIVVLRSADWDGWAVERLQREVGRDGAGQQVVLDRLLDLVLVDALRTALTSGALAVPAWLAAAGDPVVARVLQLMQEQPGEPWTIASLAKTVGVSRPVLARRFHEIVGEPPMTFLTSWRMAVAADLLAAGTGSVAQVGAAVGYGSPFTFSTAFKRVHGVSPRDHRRRALASASAAPDDRWVPA